MALGNNPAMDDYFSNMSAPRNSLCIICSKPAKVQKSEIYNSHAEFISIIVTTLHGLLEGLRK